MSQPRVLHVAEILQGGIATYLIEALPVQAQVYGAHQVCLLAPDKELTHLPTLQGVDLLRYERQGRDPASVFRLLRAVHAAVKSFKPDVVHAHSSFAGVAVRALAPLWGARRPKIVYSAQGWSFLRDVKRWKNAVMRLAERLLTRNCDALVNVSHAEQSALIAAGFPAAKCHVIRNGISAPLSKAAPVEVQLDPAKLNCLFVGRFDYQKGVDVLLAAFREMPADRYALYMIGAAALNDLTTSDAALPAHIHKLGWLPRERAIASFGLFDVVIMPSRWEGFSFVALEAMSCSMPIVASSRPPFTEAVEDGQTGRLFSLENPQQLSAILSTLDKNELKAMGRRGREKFEREFSAELMNEKTFALYRDLLAGTPA